MQPTLLPTIELYSLSSILEMNENEQNTALHKIRMCLTQKMAYCMYNSI